MNILQMSISAGVLVIAIVLIRAVALNRLPKKMFLVLWGVVLFRLFAPVSIPLPFNVPNIITTIGEISKTALSDNSVPSVVDNTVNTSEAITGITNNPVIGITEIPEVVAQRRFFNIAPTTAIWPLGMLAVFIFFAVIYYKNQKRLRYAMVIRDNDYLNEWLAEHRLLRPIAIMQSDRIISPLAVGILKPRIILPKSMNMSDKQLLDYVLTHEYFHIKRYDALWKMFLLLALCVHWFNPMVWVMFVLASRDLELTCDEAVIYRFGAKTKKAYAYMLIGMAEQQGNFAPLYNGFSKNATEERIISIMKYKKSTFTAVVLAVLLVIVGSTTAFATSAVNAGKRENAEQFDRQTDVQTEAENGTVISSYAEYSMTERESIKTGIEENIKPYEPFGLSYDSETNMMMYDGRPVREIYNPKTATLISITAGTGFVGRAAPEGAIDLTTVYDGENLAGLKVSTQAEFDARTHERLSASETAGIKQRKAEVEKAIRESNAKAFSVYEQYGLTYNKEANRLYYNNKLVRYFEDNQATDGAFNGTTSSSIDGEIDIHAVRGLTGKLIDVEPYSQADFEARTLKIQKEKGNADVSATK